MLSPVTLRSWTRLQSWQEKARSKEKLTLVWVSLVYGMMKRMTLGEEENIILFKFGLIVPTVLNCYFDIIRADVVYQPGEKLSLFTQT